MFTGTYLGLYWRKIGCGSAKGTVSKHFGGSQVDWYKLHTFPLEGMMMMSVVL